MGSFPVPDSPRTRTVAVFGYLNNLFIDKPHGVTADHVVDAVAVARCRRNVRFLIWGISFFDLFANSGNGGGENLSYVLEE